MDNTQIAAQHPKKRIVIVEDNNELAEIFKTQMEAAGYITIVANNGITGLYNIQQQIPDLVLLDLMVPDIAGDQILLRMRSSSWGKDIPVYVISNLAEADAPAGLRDLGILGYSIKADVSGGQLVDIVKSIFGEVTNNPPNQEPSPPETNVLGSPNPPQQ